MGKKLRNTTSPLDFRRFRDSKAIFKACKNRPQKICPRCIYKLNERGVQLMNTTFHILGFSTSCSTSFLLSFFFFVWKLCPKWSSTFLFFFIGATRHKTIWKKCVKNWLDFWQYLSQMRRFFFSNYLPLPSSFSPRHLNMVSLQLCCYLFLHQFPSEIF